MKKLILLILLFSGCAGPTKVIVKECRSIGSNLYECEEIPPKNMRMMK